MRITATPVWTGRAQLGEGPLWSPEHQALLFVDIRGSRLMAHFPGRNETCVWSLEEACCWLVPRTSGPGFIAGLRSRVVHLTLDDEGPHVEREIARPEAEHLGNRFNDGKADPTGRLWFGSMNDAETADTGNLYRLDERGLLKADTGYTVANGPAVSPDGTTLYHTDSPARTVYAFDLDRHGKLANKRVHLRFAESDGYPDGMTCDAQGGLWVAHWDGGRVTRFLPDGSPERIVEVPASRVTSCAFGGDDYRELYITTAAVGCDEAPQAGRLFRAMPGVTGLPADRFAG
ncbi:SMP-30/gluconolactonase/LRE family protein [Halomonas shantousis]